MTLGHTCLTLTGSILGTLVIATCAPTAVPSPRNPTSQEPSNPYSVTQVDASRPDRAAKPQNGAPALPPLSPSAPRSDAQAQAPADAGCDAEGCEGELTATAKQQIVQAMAAVTECYETELKGNDALEGRFSVLVRLPGEAGTPAVSCRPTLENAQLKWSTTFADCVAAALGKVSARGKGGCVDVAVPLNLVRKEVQASESSPAAPKDESTGAAPRPSLKGSAAKDKREPAAAPRQ